MTSDELVLVAQEHQRRGIAIASKILLIDPDDYSPREAMRYFAAAAALFALADQAAPQVEFAL